MEGFHSEQPLFGCQHPSTIMSSRHRHLRQWEGPAFFPSAPTRSIAVMVRRGLKML